MESLNLSADFRLRFLQVKKQWTKPGDIPGYDADPSYTYQDKAGTGTGTILINLLKRYEDPANIAGLR